MFEWEKVLLSIFSMREVLKGNGTPNQGIRYSLEGLDWDDVESQVNKFAPNWKYKGRSFHDLRDKFRQGETVEVGPAAHYCPGGILINEKYETSVRGLFAAGECTTGLFGSKSDSGGNFFSGRFDFFFLAALTSGDAC